MHFPYLKWKYLAVLTSKYNNTNTAKLQFLLLIQFNSSTITNSTVFKQYVTCV